MIRGRADGGNNPISSDHEKHVLSSQVRALFGVRSGASGDFVGMSQEGPKVRVAHVESEHTLPLSDISIL